MPTHKPTRPSPGIALNMPRMADEDEPTSRAFDQVALTVRQLQARVGAVSEVANAAGPPAVLSWVNVADFGAIGNGVADDTVAIQKTIDAAENAAGVVWVPPGIHLISDTLYIPSKVVLTGVGRGDYGRLKASASFPTDGRAMVRLGRVADTLVFGCRVERIMIDGNSVAKVGVFSTAANEQSGVRDCVVSFFTQYGIHFNGASGIRIVDVEVFPPSGGATDGIRLENVAIDNLISRATVGVNGLLANGIHLLSTQCVCESIHAENCTAGINLDTNSNGILIGVSGPGVTPNVGDLILASSGNVHVGIGLVKNNATRLLTSSFSGYINSDAVMPIWVGGDAIFSGAFHMTRETSPAQITANQNDYTPAAFASSQSIRISSDAARDITGLVAANIGRTVWLYNVGAFNITLKHQNAGSAATNRIIGRANADVVILPGTTAQLLYSAVGRWQVMNNP